MKGLETCSENELFDKDNSNNNININNNNSNSYEYGTSKKLLVNSIIL